MEKEISQDLVENLRREIQSEMTKKLAGWVIAGAASLLLLAALRV